MADFNSVAELKSYLTVEVNKVPELKKEILVTIGKYLQKAVKDKYGRQQPGWPVVRNNPTPLVRTGELRDSVMYEVGPNTAVVFSTMEWLAMIHEFGASWTMTDAQRRFLFGVVFKDEGAPTGRPRASWGNGVITIPARPLWRTVANTEEGTVNAIIESYLEPRIFN